MNKIKESINENIDKLNHGFNKIINVELKDSILDVIDLYESFSAGSFDKKYEKSLFSLLEEEINLFSKLLHNEKLDCTKEITFLLENIVTIFSNENTLCTQRVNFFNFFLNKIKSNNNGLYDILYFFLSIDLINREYDGIIEHNFDFNDFYSLKSKIDFLSGNLSWSKINDKKEQLIKMLYKEYNKLYFSSINLLIDSTKSEVSLNRFEIFGNHANDTKKCTFKINAIFDVKKDGSSFENFISIGNESIYVLFTILNNSIYDMLATYSDILENKNDIQVEENPYYSSEFPSLFLIEENDKTALERKYMYVGPDSFMSVISLAGDYIPKIVAFDEVFKQGRILLIDGEEVNIKFKNKPSVILVSFYSWDYSVIATDNMIIGNNKC